MDGQLDAKQLIDRIVYLASLVSEPRSVDTTLDELRVITASSSQLSPRDIDTLKSIKTRLEDHLLHKERLRSFTDESLHTIVERHFATADPIKDARKAALGRIITTVLVVSAITGSLVALRLMHGQVVLAFFICLLFGGLALLFQSIKKDLVAQLHGSVNYLMAAVICNGFFALNFPIIAANSHLERMYMMQHGGFLIGAIPVYVFYYLAFYLYAKQLQVAVPRALRPAGAAITAVIVAIVSALLPHPVAVPDEFFFDLAVIGFAVSVYFSGIAAVVGLMAVPKTTALYSKSILFLAISMVMQTIGNGYFLMVVTFMSGDFSVNDQRGQVLTGMLVVVALAFQYVAAYKSKMSLH